MAGIDPQRDVSLARLAPIAGRGGISVGPTLDPRTSRPGQKLQLAR